MKDEDKTKEQFINELAALRQQVSELETERKRTAELFTALNNRTTVGIYVVRNGRFQFVNSIFQKYVGYSKEELLAMDSLSLVWPEDRDMVRENAVSMLKGKRCLPYEFRYICKGGEIKWVIEAVVSIPYQGEQCTMGSFMDITERKQAETKYRQLLEDINDGYGVIKEGKFVFANRRLGDIFGCEPVQIIGKSFIQFTMPNDRQAAMEQYERVMRGKETAPERHEAMAMKVNGTPIIIETSRNAIQYEGKPAFSIIFKDITERKRMKEEFQRNYAIQNMLNTLIKLSLEDISLEEILKRTLDLVLSIPWFALEAKGCIFLVEDEPDTLVMKAQSNLNEFIQMACTRVTFGKCLCGRAALTQEIQFAGHIDNHHEISCEGASPHGHYIIPFLSDKKVLGIMSLYIKEGHVRSKKEEEFLSSVANTLSGVIERKRAEASLRESEEKLRLIFESVPEGVALSDIEGRLIDINDGVVNMHGYDTKGELIGRNAAVLIAERDHTMVIKDMKKLLETGSIGIRRYTFAKKDGSEFPVAANVAVIKDAAGHPIGFVAIHVDTTEQQKMQQQLMLADRLSSIGQLTAGIAHEINNPLTSVIGFTELLLEKDLPDEINEDLRVISKEANRIANVTKGLLTFVQSKGTEKDLVDINSIIKEVLQLRIYEQRLSNIKVKAQFDPDLPRVIGNGAQMQQVFMNLIINAEQAMIETHGRGRLKVITGNAGKMVLVSITDDGPGISPENMKKLFSPFFTTKEVGKGTGLGLSICHGIVTEHGGSIYVESELGKGASFVLELPIPASRGESVVKLRREYYKQKPDV